MSTEISGGRRGQSLINPASAVKFVFEEGFEKAIDSFTKLKKTDRQKCRDEWMVETEIALDILKDKARQSDVDDSVLQSDDDSSSIIRRQFDLWLGDCEGIESILRYLQEKKKGGVAGIQIDVELGDHPFKRFVNYITEVCEQAKGYLGQYAETIATLPKKFSSSSDIENDAGGNDVGNPVCAGVALNPDELSGENNSTVMYWRHYKPVVQRESGDKVPGFITDPFKGTNNLYIEPLSGTQSYLAQI